MKDLLVFKLTAFLKSHLKEEEKFLLALSGGNDSLTLFYMLLECQKLFPFKFGIAHVDHGWREESNQEACELKRLAEKHSLPFHLEKLRSPLSHSNLEATCREARLSFFSEVCRTGNYRAVVLGHQLDDVAETVLKKIFEGAALTCCNGILETVTIGALEIWRPLLNNSKKELAEWLENRGVVPFTDKTNFDPKFLRARMRQEIIPYLEQMFGKGIITTLTAIGKESDELTDFLELHLNCYLERAISGPFGTGLDLSSSVLSLFELKWIIRSLCKWESIVPSKEIIENAALCLKNRSFQKEFRMNHKLLFVDRGRLFVMKSDLPPLPNERIAITKEGEEFGPWQVRVEDCEESLISNGTSWKELWSGKGQVFLPKSDESYFIGAPDYKACYPSKGTLAKWYSQHQIPPFLRNRIPLIWKGEGIGHEFLTGKTKSHDKKNPCWQRISLIVKG